MRALDPLAAPAYLPVEVPRPEQTAQGIGLPVGACCCDGTGVLLLRKALRHQYAFTALVRGAGAVFNHGTVLLFDEGKINKAGDMDSKQHCFRIFYF